MPTLAGNKHSPSTSSFTDRVFSIYRQKSYGSDPSELDIKVVIPAPTQEIKHKQKIKDISIQGKNTRMHWKGNLKYEKIKYIILKGSCLHSAAIKSTVGSKLGLFSSPFHVSTSSRLTLAGAFRGGYLSACSTAFRSTTEENDSGGYVDVPCPSKVKQHSSTADWLRF